VPGDLGFRREEHMPRLTLSLDDQDTALLGLMGDWKRYPDWLTGALAECIARAPLALIHSCEVTRLIGLL